MPEILTGNPQIEDPVAIVGAQAENVLEVVAIVGAQAENVLEVSGVNADLPNLHIELKNEAVTTIDVDSLIVGKQHSSDGAVTSKSQRLPNQRICKATQRSRSPTRGIYPRPSNIHKLRQVQQRALYR
jgi:hypothetical protein